MKVFGLISDERAFHSRSPAMHTAVLRRRSIPGVYLPFAVQPGQLGQALGGLRALGLAGANVTVPYKEAVLPHLDDLSGEARAIGAVNTIVRQGERLEGHNTDAAGFADALIEAGFEAFGRTALVLGTGGAAKAVVFALRRLGAGEIIVAGRNQAGAQEPCLAGAAFRTLDSLPGRPTGAQVVINATSVSAPSESPQLAGLVLSLAEPDCLLLFDLNYGRQDNFWQTLALKWKCPFRDGMTMLAHQARHSFKLWTGVEVEAQEFLEAGLEVS